ncbi:PTS ascorbate transporter subunit IIC [Bacillus sp. FJAT-50079]|uniref:PTS ascorbate transporter subunit IIC n=1 Tax=Bacillus sp. FJAT-50079 TaxID=2833577 RepID=UPI001BC9DE1E|nr:PTS ascorbate transporter subunit IIC [Bacillus sp. FJAT-50079]MBS4210179.1 PTS transporter subunit IIC [Bacillus sp. FJAT-50079]
MENTFDYALTAFQFFFDNILAKPEFFIGLLVFLGYMLLGKGLAESFSGFIKAAVGFMILLVGSSGMVGAFSPVLTGLIEKYDLKAAVIDSNFGYAAANKGLESIGESTSLTMVVLLVGFLFNILLIALKRITKIRTLFITGHIMVKQSAFLTFMVFYAVPSLRSIEGAIIIGILIGTYWAVFSNLTLEATDSLVGERAFAVGHPQMFGIWLVDKFAAKFGDKNKTIDNVKLPKAISVMSDNVVGTSVVMLLMFGAVLIALGPETMKELDPGTYKDFSFAAYVVSKCLSFTVFFLILQMGVKMFVSELIESFMGISNKLLKGSVPAVDCAATFGFANPNTILLGFICGTIGQIVAILGLLVFKSPIMIISGFVPLFFDNATLAVFAHNKGGVRAAVIMPIISGVLQVLGGAIGVLMFSLYQFGGWYGNLDFATAWIGFGFLIKNFEIIGLVLALIIMLAIPQLQYLRNKDKYFEGT